MGTLPCDQDIRDHMLGKFVSVRQRQRQSRKAEQMAARQRQDLAQRRLEAEMREQAFRAVVRRRSRRKSSLLWHHSADMWQNRAVVNPAMRPSFNHGARVSIDMAPVGHPLAAFRDPRAPTPPPVNLEV